MSYLTNLSDYSKKSRYLVTVDGACDASIISTTDFLNEIQSSKIVQDFGSSFTFRLFLSTDITYAYEDPLDDQTPLIQWNPIITQIPVVSTDLTKSFFGFFPTFSGNFQCENTNRYFSKLANSSVINDRSIKIYHVIGDAEPVNTQVIFEGFGSQITVELDRVNITVKDKSTILDKKLEHSESITFLKDGTGLSELPDDRDRSPYKVYGRSNGKRAFPVGSNDYITHSGTDDLDEYLGNCFPSNPDGGGNFESISISTANYADGYYLQPNDTIEITSLVTPAKKFYTRITSPVTYSNILGEYFANIDPEIPSGFFTGAELLGNFTFERGCVASVYELSGGTANWYYYKQDYTIQTNVVNGTTGFNFIPGTTNDLYCNLVGPTNATEINATSYGRNFITESTDVFGQIFLYGSGLLQFDHTIILDFFKKYLGLTEDEIDTDRFLDYESLMDLRPGPDDISDPDFQDIEGIQYLSVPYNLSIPFSSNGEMPTAKDVLTLIANSSLVQFYYDRQGKFTYRYYFDNRSSSVRTLKDSDFEYIRYDYIYSDIYGQLRFANQGTENNPDGANGQRIQIFDADNGVDVTQNRQVSINTFNLSEIDNDYFGTSTINQQRKVFGIRRGILEIRCDRSQFDLDVGDFVDIDTEFLPGFESEDSPRKMLIVSRQLGIDTIIFKLDDIKSIKDNNLNVPIP